MVKANRLDWSRKRVITGGAASFGTALILGLSGHRMFDPGSLPPILWLAAFGNMVQWCAYLATTLGDELLAKRREEIREEVREAIRTEVATLLKRIDSKVDEIDADVHSYGNQREADGKAEGLALVAQILGQRGNAGGRHLNLVD